MKAAAPPPADFDEVLADFPPAVRRVLRKIRRTVAAAAPGAREAISYRMPAFFLEGVLVYFAAFKGHVGLYPPVSGDARLETAIAPYAGEKGNLRFPLAEPIPYALIERIVKHRARQNRARAAARRGTVAPFARPVRFLTEPRLPGGSESP